MTVDGRPVDKLQVTVTAGDFSSTLKCSGGNFTLYEIPDDPTITFHMIDSKTGDSSSLEYAFKNSTKKKTLKLTVALSLRPKFKDDEAGSKRDVNWKDPDPEPGRDSCNYTLKYKYELKAKPNGQTEYTPLQLDAADAQGTYHVQVVPKSTIMCKTTIVGLPAEQTTYYSV